MNFLRQHATRHGSSTFRRFASSANVVPRNRLRRLATTTAYTSIGLGSLYFLDREANASAVTRNLRTLYTCAAIALDYKINFHEATSDAIPALHERVAERIYDLLTSNGGLYIKMGQAIGANAAFLPRPIQAKFAKLFDDAPQIPYSDVARVFQSEFGRPPAGPDGVFAEFEQQAVASASVAQVHKARLRDTDEWVAVKIQKPDVSKQVEWDLGAFRAVMWMYENWIFDLPVYFITDFISDHLRQELDFVQEAKHAMETATYVANEPRLADRVHVPNVYPEYSTKKVMTAEWIDGVRLSDRAGIRRLMGEPEDSDVPSPPGAPLSGGVRAVIGTMVDLFCAQIFDWGWVHCDPHPGNVIVREHPRRPGQMQLVLLDHGLYVRMGPEFRRQYAALWKGLLVGDWATVGEVTTQWGFGAPDLFASATLLRPVRFGRGKKQEKEGSQEEEKLSQYEMGVRMKAKLRAFLTDTDKMPKELVFIGRNMRIVQGNNQSFGSPVNRIKVMGTWASGALTTSPNLPFRQRLREYWSFTVFRVGMFALDLAFWSSRLRGWAMEKVGIGRGGGFEDELELSMRLAAKSNFGLDIGPEAFHG